MSKFSLRSRRIEFNCNPAETHITLNGVRLIKKKVHSVNPPSGCPTVDVTGIYLILIMTSRYRVGEMFWAQTVHVVN